MFLLHFYTFAATLVVNRCMEAKLQKVSLIWRDIFKRLPSPETTVNADDMQLGYCRKALLKLHKICRETLSSFYKNLHL